MPLVSSGHNSLDPKPPEIAGGSGLKAGSGRCPDQFAASLKRPVLRADVLLSSTRPLYTQQHVAAVLRADTPLQLLFYNSQRQGPNRQGLQRHDRAKGLVSIILKPDQRGEANETAFLAAMPCSAGLNLEPSLILACRMVKLQMGHAAFTSCSSPWPL